MKEIQELFSPPIGLEPAIKISGTTFYSSDKLKRNFNIAFKKSSKGKDVAPEIIKLVKKNEIIPCYKSKNLTSFLRKKFFKTADDSILAFYEIDIKKVVVTIDNEITIFGTASNNKLASTTMHECMHLAAAKNFAGFLRIFFHNLVLYYTAFFTDYLKLKENQEKNITEVIRYLATYERKGPRYANKELNNYFKLLYNLFEKQSKLDGAEFQIRLTNMIVACKLMIVSFPSLESNINKFVMLFTSLNNAYKTAFGSKNDYTFPIQETVSLSEVACVLSEMKPQDKSIKQLFKLIS